MLTAYYIMAASSVSAISDREVKRLEKVLVQEAKADQKSIEDAIKNVKQAEKTLHKCAKVCSILAPFHLLD